MPANEPGTITRQQAADIAAYILQTDKFPAGRTELASDDAALKAIALPGGKPARAPATNATGPVFPPAGKRTP